MVVSSSLSSFSWFKFQSLIFLLLSFVQAIFLDVEYKNVKKIYYYKKKNQVKLMYYHNNFVINSQMILGLAFQAVFFITCHTKNHIVVVFHHLYCSTIAGFSSKTDFTIFSSSLSSGHCTLNHFSDIISSTFFQVF